MGLLGLLKYIMLSSYVTDKNTISHLIILRENCTYKLLQNRERKRKRKGERGEMITDLTLPELHQVGLFVS